MEFENFKLGNLPYQIKKMLSLYLVVLMIGTTLGLVYLYHHTGLTNEGTKTHYAGEESDDEFSSNEGISYGELLMTTHNHILSFSMIYLVLGVIFNFNTIITGKIKMFLMIEPFVSILLTFGGIWCVKYIHSSFGYIIILSGILMYLCFYAMSIVSLVNLLKKN